MELSSIMDLSDHFPCRLEAVATEDCYHVGLSGFGHINYLKWPSDTPLFKNQLLGFTGNRVSDLTCTICDFKF